ncbi:MAG: SDR family NAD(P)-dependent oxidoreductase, partial [Pseudomonadota bacterium]
SFLQGHNAAYVDQLYARYARDPSSVDESWRRYFASLNENADQVQAEAEGPSWARADWPPQPMGDLTSALTGEWAPDLDVAPKKIAEKVQAKAQAAGAQAQAVQADMARPGAAEALWDAAEAGLGPVHGFVNNAGVIGRGAPLADRPPEDIRRVIDLNVTGAILAAQPGQQCGRTGFFRREGGQDDDCGGAGRGLDGRGRGDLDPARGLHRLPVEGDEGAL